VETEPVCQFLEWDSDFFGCRIARVNGNYLDAQRVEDINAWCFAERIDCLYFLATADDQISILSAEENRFRLVDLRVTFEKQLSSDEIHQKKTVSNIAIRLCKEDDIRALKGIAKVSYNDSRFYFDNNFPRHLCDALYETWIEKSCEGYADAVLVATIKDVPVGFITCTKLYEQSGEIGLVGVSVERQGMGIGHELLAASSTWFRSCGVKDVKVVTQGRNIKAQRLYQRHGFLAHSVQIWYHKWFLNP
jgi:dTDP-4-amino-4,6-dideoxy-D-galactose acyltransferase